MVVTGILTGLPINMLTTADLVGRFQTGGSRKRMLRKSPSQLVRTLVGKGELSAGDSQRSFIASVVSSTRRFRSRSLLLFPRVSAFFPQTTVGGSHREGN
jgi:hypothetical protein